MDTHGSQNSPIKRKILLNLLRSLFILLLKGIKTSKE
jgi:hypothetical protein